MGPPVVLFGLARSVYTRIARLALEEKGVPYTLESVEIFGPTGVPPEHLRRHPFGRIPAFTHGDFSLFETAAICRYVDEAFSGPALQPPAASSRARMAQLIALLDSYAYRPMVWGVFVQRLRLPLQGGVADEALISTSLKQARTALVAIAALMDDSAFLVGPALSLADLHAYPMLKCFSLAPEGAAAIAEHPRVATWMSGLAKRLSVQHTLTPYEQSSPGACAA